MIVRPRTHLLRRASIAVRVSTALAFGAALALPLRPASAQPATSGTYAFWICQGACRSPNNSTVFARGTIVLFDSALRADSLPPLRSARLDGEQPNACFVFQQRPPTSQQTYAGIEPHATTSWRRSGPDVVTLSLFRSPDAFYTVRLIATERSLFGAGHSSGAGVADISVPDDSIGLRRLGPPRYAACRRAPGEQRR